MSAAAAEEPASHSGVPFADASPGEVRATLIPEDAARFEHEWREALSRAADSLDLTEVLDVLARWRRTAWLTTTHGHAGYRQLLADADRILTTGERPAGTLPLSALRARLGSARLNVTDPTEGASVKIELGIDWRRLPPADHPPGPVLAADDAVANKVTALYSRTQARDYIDVHTALDSGRYREADLLRLALDHDPGFEPAMFATALRAIKRLPGAEFTADGLAPEQIDVLTARLLSWAESIEHDAG